MVKGALKDVVSALVTVEESTVKRQLDKLINRYKAGGANIETETPDIVELVLRLDTQFPRDVGHF